MPPGLAAPAACDLWAGVGLSLGFLALIGAAEAWRRLGQAPTEWTRKLVHAGGGLGCLALPFLIESHWVVLVMAIGLAAVFMISRRTGRLRSLHDVERRSRGTEYFPLVVYVLFVLAHDRPWLYVICVLVLAVSDSAAALIGSRYGRIRYEVEQDRKSLEGSLAFAVITYAAIAGPLLSWNDPAIPPAANCALAALLAALLVTGFEAVSLDGRDNLFVPLGTYLVLSKLLRQPLDEIVLQTVSFVVIAAMIGAAAWRSRMLNVGGALIVVLWTFACWSLGSFDWVLPVFLGLGAYLVVRLATLDRLMVRVRLAVRSVGPMLAALAGANLAWQFDRPDLYRFLHGPFVAGCAIVTMQICWNRCIARCRVEGAQAAPRVKRPAVAAAAGAAAAILVGAPGWWLQATVGPSALVSLVGVTTACAAAYELLTPAERRPDRAGPVGPLNRVTLAGMAIVAALQWIGASASWAPS